MAAKILTSLVGMGRAPTVLYGRWLTSTDAPISTLDWFLGTVQSAEITSASLAEVLNISGSGIIDILAFGGLASAVNPAKIRIVIDGVTVLDESGLAFAATNALRFVLGNYKQETASNHKSHMSEQPAVFNSSLVVSIAGDGTDGLIAGYRYYLT